LPTPVDPTEILKRGAAVACLAALVVALNLGLARGPEWLVLFFHTAAAAGLVLLSLVGAVACGSPDDTIKKQVQTAASWTSAAAMIGREWLRGAVPARYAGPSLETADKSLGKAIASVHETSQAGGRPNPALDSLLGSTVVHVEAMRSAIERDDRAAVRARAETLATAGQRLTALSSGS
jgi:hypothetical protein